MSRVAVADVGTNSSHLLIAEARPGGYRVLDALKEPTRLGECLQNGLLTEEGYSRLEVALSRFRQLAEGAGVREVRVYATSAMREARNGPQIAERLRAATGIYPVIISGEREGALTYQGAAHSVEFGPDNLLMDLGGGSLELARGGPERAEVVVSLPIGSVRAGLALAGKDPPGAKALRELRGSVEQALKPPAKTFACRPGTQAIGSSGSFEAAAAMLQARAGREGLGVNGYRFTRAALSDLLRDLERLPLAKRLRVPGLDRSRADIIVAGLVIIETTLRMLGVEHVTVSEGALREGMLAEELAREAAWEARLSARQRSVLEVAERFRADHGHARGVASLSRDLYGRLEAAGEVFPPESRSLLTAGAMLHEIGLIVGQSSHHKHGLYLTRHAGLRGYSPEQIETIGLLVRYHRKSLPKVSHAEFTALPPDAQALVKRLGAVLRVADGLDRSHSQEVRVRQLTRQQRRWTLTVTGASDLDLQGARDKSDLWNEAYGELEIRAG